MPACALKDASAAKQATTVAVSFRMLAIEGFFSMCLLRPLFGECYPGMAIVGCLVTSSHPATRPKVAPVLAIAFRYRSVVRVVQIVDQTMQRFLDLFLAALHQQRIFQRILGHLFQFSVVLVQHLDFFQAGHG